MKKDNRALVRQLERAGYDVRRTANGHFMVYIPGHQPVCIAGTPSGNRSMANTRALLKRAGVEL